MTTEGRGCVRLADLPGKSRTTSSLVASLATRLSAMHVVTGGTAIGSLVAGMAALGREAGQTADGARLRDAIATGRPGVNGLTLWTALQIPQWLSLVPPAPILDELRNDMALLLATDLEATITSVPSPGQAAGSGAPDAEAEVTFIDCVVGLWAFSTELTRAIETLAAPQERPAGTVDVPPPDGSGTGRTLLR